MPTARPGMTNESLQSETMPTRLPLSAKNRSITSVTHHRAGNAEASDEEDQGDKDMRREEEKNDAKDGQEGENMLHGTGLRLTQGRAMFAELAKCLTLY